MQFVNDPLLSQLLETRLDETLFIYHWKRNEMLLSRKYGYQLLRKTYNLRKVVDIHNILAQGYLFESYEQAMHHAQAALDIATEIDSERAIYGLRNYTIPFLSAHHAKTKGITTEDQAEKAHLALANGDFEMCVQILEAFDKFTPFQQYYLGKATRDKQLLRKSYRRFIEERDDYFYAMLPLQALNQLDS
ncbi:hypothetical protein J416_11602 [Gracilibacillus halophilus YIM-C55.5]|uniref:Uncharacterized protein n=1 Tax=Gracilibacillus halophilus YIM-C55.5 TaxID=1308866 RepID=N4WAJ4_9BACI|nr:hypothetical protein J416_11602 [Gracilibacillus halophilus YIM-C55.5]